MSLQVTLRPCLWRRIRPASSSTARCFITAGSDMAKGAASALTVSPSAADPAAPRRASRARRVGSASAAKVRSSVGVFKLTIWFSIAAPGTGVKPSARQAGESAPA